MASIPEDGASLLETSRRSLPSFSDPTNENRLSAPTTSLMLYSMSFAGLSGFLVGYHRTARMAALRFRAEHAHKMPRNTRQLFFYHRRKNYYVAKHGILSGFKAGGRLAFWSGTFFLAEASVDFLRDGRKDFVSTTTAATGIAGLFSLMSRSIAHEAFGQYD